MKWHQGKMRQLWQFLHLFQLNLVAGKLEIEQYKNYIWEYEGLYCLTNITRHWCIKPIYNGFAIAKDYTLKNVPFGFCSVQVMPLFRISFGYLREEPKNGLAATSVFLGFRHIWGRSIYLIPLKLQCRPHCWDFVRFRLSWLFKVGELAGGGSLINGRHWLALQYSYNLDNCTKTSICQEKIHKHW